MEKRTLRAVHDDDLEAVLQALGLLHDYKAGTLKCTFCGTRITHQNLHSLLPDSGAVKAVCSRPECVSLLVDRLGSRA